MTLTIDNPHPPEDEDVPPPRVAHMDRQRDADELPAAALADEATSPAEDGDDTDEPDEYVTPAILLPPREEPTYDIRIERFHHRYGGFVAVHELDVALPRGTITGFIGPNGAGKTTTIQLLATLLQPTRGDAFVGGFSCTRQRAQARRVLGYMPDSFGVYEGLTAREYLEFFARAHRLPAKGMHKHIAELAELVNLEDRMEAPASGLSFGQRQRLSLARTLLHDPKVLILDEPASGLDPLARIGLLGIMRELRAMGKTLLVSSHILTEVSEICDQLIIMAKGRMVAFGTLDDIARQVRPHFCIELQAMGDGAARAAAWLRERGVASVRHDGEVVEFDYVGERQGLVEMHRALILEGIPLLYFQPVEVTLEQAFAQLVGGTTAQPPTPDAVHAIADQAAHPGADSEADPA